MADIITTSDKESAYPGPRSYKSASKAVHMRAPATTTRSDHSKRDSDYSEQDSGHSRRDTEHFLQYYQSSLADFGSQTYANDSESTPSTHLSRQTSAGSTSPSDYSSDSKTTDIGTTSTVSESSSKARLRSGVQSDGGSDRRRLAIVEMDTMPGQPPKPSSGHSKGQGSIRSRRGLPSSLAGLALVAPPDAAPHSYTHLTPPSTAPITGETNSRDATRDGHHRSASEAVMTGQQPPRKGIDGAASSSRDVPEKLKSHGRRTPVIQQGRHSRSPSPSAVSDAADPTHTLLSPAHARPAMGRQDTQQSLILTPEIGEEKDIDTRVAAPVVISLDSAGPFQRRKEPRNASPTTQVVQPVAPTSFPSAATSPYLHYQPGVHAIAGPLPPPPRAMFNIDTNSPVPPRPPRLNSPFSSRSRGDIEAVKQALQLPPSVTAALASRTPRSNPDKYLTSPEDVSASPKKDPAPESSPSPSTDSSELRHVKSVHRREGAFTPSTGPGTTSESDGSVSHSEPASSSDVVFSDNLPNDPTGVLEAKPENDQSSSDDEAGDEVPPIIIIQPLKHSYHEQQVNPNDTMGDITVAKTRKRLSDDLSSSPSRSRSRSPPSIGHTGETPSPPPKSFRNSLATNLKRFSSLPRTPSISSRSTRSARRSSGGTQYSSRTPSPSLMLPQHPPPHPPPPLPKIRSQYPAAMFCNEISSKKTSLERCLLYAQKINELYMYDCGLGDWTIETKLRANTNRPTVTFSAHTFTPQPRHTSRASMISEATFPRRPDASLATDLSIKTQDLIPAPPPALPYPSLANQRMHPPKSSSSVSSGTPPSSIRSLAPSTPTSKAGGFFASLGRKASMTSAKKDKNGPSTPSSSSPGGARLLTKNPPTNPTPRTINISNSPSVPGGPRALPGHRALRSQTIMTTTSPFTSSSVPTERTDVLARRPSLSNLSQEPAVIDIAADPEFVHQVDKLADLLPRADRDVLAGYLRRAGQDILAIGQYLEDEKNGTIKT
ncbi:hypothetical protein Hypma_009641 [Hypsizygus marmoreus]|uniref:Uncharacterized protein n=1 Tax=Hypsizygus marmoreus TaxID=39966 RepID=A0A369JX11_HYPMA|nr:hypothetical protein Hypma_009641 [Hypsizygus marmoreus]